MTVRNDIQKAHNINFVIGTLLILAMYTSRAVTIGFEEVPSTLYLGMLCITLGVYLFVTYFEKRVAWLLPMSFGIYNALRIPYEGYKPEIQALVMASLIMMSFYLSRRYIYIHLIFLNGILFSCVWMGFGDLFSPAVSTGGMPGFTFYLLSVNLSSVLFLFMIKRVRILHKQLEAQIDTNQFSCKELTMVEEELKLKCEELEENNEQLADMNEQLAYMNERFSLILESANEAMFEWEFNNGMIFHSEKMHSVLGLERKEKLNKRTIMRMLSDGEDKIIREEIIEAVKNEECYLKEIRLKHGTGAERWVCLRAVFQKSEVGLPIRMIGTIMDITRQKKNEMIIRRLAYTDSVTGLPNREAIFKKHDKLMNQGYNGVLIAGLTNFSDINANYGYESGDRILKSIGERLIEVIPDAIVSRLRAADFAILVKGGLAGIERTLGILEKTFGNAFHSGTKEVHLKYSVGAALSGIHGEGYEIMLKRANLALLEARRGGYEGVRIFEKSLESDYEERINMENDFHTAVFNGEIKVLFQPKFRTKGTLYGFEALARWDRKGSGIISPEIFINLAEETGLIVDMGLFVAKKACDFLNVLTDRNMKPEGNVSINISPVQLAESDFVESLCEVVRAAGADASHIGLEITESVFIGNKEEGIRKLNRLRHEGFKIYLDDFGKDYSNFSYLEDLPLDYIKIDKEFIKRLEVEGNSKVIVKSIIDLTHSLGCRVVAEGVETEKQLALLHNLDCDFVQGYLKGRPANEDDAYEIAKIG